MSSASGEWRFPQLDEAWHQHALREERRRLRHQETGVCPDAPHRGPEGPNEDLDQCPTCLRISWCRRPAGETFGWHDDDCSLPVDHESYCAPGGTGHPAEGITRIRGFWPDDPRSPDYRR